MATRSLPKTQWESYFDRLARHLKASQAEIEVVGMNLGDQLEGEWVPFYGISYDPRSDVIEMVLEGVEHLVTKPSEVIVDEGVEGLDSIEILASDGVRHVAKFKKALKLPPSV